MLNTIFQKASCFLVTIILIQHPPWGYSSKLNSCDFFRVWHFSILSYLKVVFNWRGNYFLCTSQQKAFINDVIIFKRYKDPTPSCHHVIPLSPFVQVSGEKNCFSKNEKGNDILNTMRFDMNVIILLEDEKL